MRHCRRGITRKYGQLYALGHQITYSLCHPCFDAVLKLKHCQEFIISTKENKRSALLNPTFISVLQCKRDLLYLIVYLLLGADGPKKLSQLIEHPLNR